METLPKIIANSKKQFEEIEGAVRTLPSDLMDMLTTVEVHFSGYKARIQSDKKEITVNIPKSMVNSVKQTEKEVTVFTDEFIFIIEKGFSKEIVINLTK